MGALLLTALAGLIGLVFVGYLIRTVLSKDRGSGMIQELSGYIHEGAMAFLFREYRSILIFVAIVAIVIIFGINPATGLAFILGAGCSIAAGYIGMQISTRANGRTTQAATQGFSEAMAVAFPGGAVMGMSVVSIGLFALAVLYYIFSGADSIITNIEMLSVTSTLAGFSMGASSVALFARVGGGIYTKAADVGADLVGKVEAGIPEDDPRNPAVIADLVGDNVGDVAGMGADLYESYVGSIVAGLVLAATTLPDNLKWKGISLCFLLAAIGILSSIIGSFFVRTSGSKVDPGSAQRSLRYGMIASAILFLIGSALLIGFWYGDMNVLYAAAAGLIAGMAIGFTAEYYTSGKSIRTIAETSTTGAATTIIQGIATGMKSTILPLVLIGLAIMIAYSVTSGTSGFFGIAIAAIGMLSITGVTVAVDAYGPISDNAGGIAEMSHQREEVRKITDSLDAAGNTTAAIAKGFAIGSAALTALALFMAYIHAANIKFEDLSILNYKVISGLFIGGVIPYIFASATMQAVGRAAFSVVEEVRRQFREIKGLMEGEATAEYTKCVDITTARALKEMIGPGILAVLIPIVLGSIFGAEMLGGILAGSLVTGVPLAVMMANAGGAWDNAKKYIEEGNLGGKGSDAHKAAVVGDTVGDPFKDTSSPSMNILLKLMAVVSLVFAPLIIAIHQWLVGLF